MALSSLGFFVGHTGPAADFAIYAQSLSQSGLLVEIGAYDQPALKKLKERGVSVIDHFLLSVGEEPKALAQRIADFCTRYVLVITDVGHPFACDLQEAFSKRKVAHYACYDNPEFYALEPGVKLPEYFTTAVRVMQVADGVFVANRRLTKWLHAYCQKRTWGIGYYPIDIAERLAQRRQTDEPVALRTKLFGDAVRDEGQKMVLYIGGNNQVYFEEAFPDFLAFLTEAIQEEDLSSLVFVLQKHPGAQAGSADETAVTTWVSAHRGQPKAPKIWISSLTCEEALVATDSVFYTQTSMVYQCPMAGIAPIFQIGKTPYTDILVSHGLATAVTDKASFLREVRNNFLVSHEEPDSMGGQAKRTQLLDALGVVGDWPKNLQQAIQEAMAT